jgi:hypothetical protein
MAISLPSCLHSTHSYYDVSAWHAKRRPEQLHY